MMRGESKKGQPKKGKSLTVGKKGLDAKPEKVDRIHGDRKTCGDVGEKGEDEDELQLAGKKRRAIERH